MTPQEKDLIQAVYDRLAKAGGGPKDAEAERFIEDLTRRQPDAAYGLTQAVIVLEAGLNQAQTKIDALQRQLDEARAGSAGGSGTGFLGGSSPWGGSSVPRSGAAPQPQQQPQQPQPSYYPQPQPQQAWPQAAPPAGPWVQQPSGGGSFLRNAATMAAGVAGGTLIAEGLSSMFGHHGGYGGYGGGYEGGGFGGGGFAGGPEIIEERTTVNNYYDDRGTGGHDRDSSDQAASGQDASYQDASYDDTGSVDDGGGFDDSGGDFGSDV